MGRHWNDENWLYTIALEHSIAYNFLEGYSCWKEVTLCQWSMSQNRNKLPNKSNPYFKLKYSLAIDLESDGRRLDCNRFKWVKDLKMGTNCCRKQLLLTSLIIFCDTSIPSSFKISEFSTSNHGQFVCSSICWLVPHIDFFKTFLSLLLRSNCC